MFGASACDRGPTAAPERFEGDIRGADESGGSPARRDMEALLRSIASDARESSLLTGERAARELRNELALRGAALPSRERFRLLRWLAFHELRLGDEAAAIARLEEAMALLPELEATGRVDASDGNRARFELAVAHLRFGERSNCVARHTSDSCILPIRPAGVHVDQDGSRRGMAMLREVLAREPSHLAARWLLNVAAMTVGGYPADVPAELLVPPESFASDEELPRFPDVAMRSGLAVSNLAGGTAVDDFDGDGVLDVVLSSSDPAAPLRFFSGRGDGRFEERSEAAGLASSLGGFALVPADYDDDGDLDLLVLRGAWLQRTGRHPKSLLRNDGRGRFADVTFAAGLGEVHFPSQSAAWADYDNDGDLDVYVGNEWTDNFAAPSQLFENRGDGTFVDVAARAGVTNERFTKGVVWGDFNGDRFPDLYVSNLNGGNRLYRNLRDGRFRDDADAAGVDAPWASYPALAFDANQDGALDLLALAYPVAHEPWTAEERPSAEPFVASLLRLPHAAERSRLYLGDGRGGFRDASVQFGLTDVVLASAAGFGDLDGDGFPDVYVGTGYPGYEGLMPNVMLRNRSGAGFADVTTAGGFGHLQKAHSLAFADLDGDGDDDVLLHAGGMFAGDAFVNAVFENPGSGSRWTSVRLAGTASNRSGVGARIRLDVVADGEPRSVYRWVGIGGGTGASPLAPRIGLGDATGIDRLEVFWPTTGITQTIEHPPLDTVLRIEEPRSR